MHLWRRSKKPSKKRKISYARTGVPGMNEKDVKVEASEHTVTIKAHKKQEEKDKGRFETFDESFEQSVHLPCKVKC